jgi:IS30 family transposase
MTVATTFIVRTYFTRPYTIHDKGTVEQRIGQPKKFIDKKTDISEVTDNQV